MITKKQALVLLTQLELIRWVRVKLQVYRHMEAEELDPRVRIRYIRILKAKLKGLHRGLHELQTGQIVRRLNKTRLLIKATKPMEFKQIFDTVDKWLDEDI